MKIFIFFILISNLIYAQNKLDTLASRTENLKWIQNLESIENKNEKIKFIVEKIKSDSLIPQNLSNETIKIRDGEEIFNTSKCKIPFLLKSQKVGHLIDLNKYPNYSIILNSINEKTINEITVLKEKKATSIYGTRARCGVVIMNTNNNELQKEIKKLKKKLRKTSHNIVLAKCGV